MVGRSAEFEHLSRHLDGLRGGGGLVVVSGEAGVGKSRLVREIAAAAEDRGLQVLTGRAVPASEPYRPLVEAMTAALRDRPMPDDDALRPYLPVLAACCRTPRWPASAPTRAAAWSWARRCCGCSPRWPAAPAPCWCW